MIKDIRSIQKVELDILLQIKRICEKNNLKYFLAYGTLLGAARHQGFIPWDDDADIWMPAPDYLTFCRVAQKELGKDYFFQDGISDPGYHYNYGKVMKNNTSALVVEEKNLGIHWGIYVDVFPFILAESQTERMKADRLLYVYNSLIRKKYRRIMNENKTLKTKVLNIIPDYVLKPIEAYYFKKALSFYKKEENTIRVLTQESYALQEFQYDWFFGDKERKLLFENHYFPVPICTEKILHKQYGDYMELPPEEKRIGHEIYGVNIIFDTEKSYTSYL